MNTVKKNLGTYPKVLLLTILLFLAVGSASAQGWCEVMYWAEYDACTITYVQEYSACAENDTNCQYAANDNYDGCLGSALTAYCRCIECPETLSFEKEMSVLGKQNDLITDSIFYIGEKSGYGILRFR